MKTSVKSKPVINISQAMDECRPDREAYLKFLSTLNLSAEGAFWNGVGDGLCEYEAALMNNIADRIRSILEDSE